MIVEGISMEVCEGIAGRVAGNGSYGRLVEIIWSGEKAISIAEWPEGWLGITSDRSKLG